MTSNNTIIEHDASTNKTIQREMTVAEQEQYDEFQHNCHIVLADDHLAQK